MPLQGFLQIIQQASGEADYTYRSLGYASSFQLFTIIQLEISCLAFKP
ncbi:hypothetical protein MC7420_6257 [Coleofasciculus chthonoplastes PCC 7420]|uniref:Uncharacterized protein n=1 Tax=Coleofasciculus chthonoplastes PCC 7420 TaxID=118168 RepID=B4VR22_9CYAN|nr:hypothetical protein [Coleofasciculus chthonoplastes]EDX75602.1 hypothetical protein MC7420_6257 [Coleofasciculus chthonoplastes PCC 7420]